MRLSRKGAFKVVAGEVLFLLGVPAVLSPYYQIWEDFVAYLKGQSLITTISIIVYSGARLVIFDQQRAKEEAELYDNLSPKAKKLLGKEGAKPRQKNAAKAARAGHGR